MVAHLEQYPMNDIYVRLMIFTCNKLLLFIQHWF